MGIPGQADDKDDDDAKILELIAERDRARKERNFKRSDAIRDELVAMGVLLEDTPEGAKWRRK